MAFPVAKQSKFCLIVFDRLAEWLEKGDERHSRFMSPGSLLNQRDRFRVWAGNLGALQQGHASLDVRLRDSTRMQETVLEFLRQLMDIMNTSIQIIRGVKLPLEEVSDRDEQHSLEDFSDDSSTSDDDRPALKTELGQNMAEIVDIVSCLFKLAFQIRSTAARSTEQLALRASLYKEMVQVDGTAKVDLLASFANFDRAHVEASFQQWRRNVLKSENSTRGTDDDTDEESDLTSEVKSQLSSSQETKDVDSWLVERWSASLTIRRRMFAYWRRHAQKLSTENMEDALVDETFQELSEELPALPKPMHPALKADRLRPDPTTQSIAGETALSGTEATIYERNLDDDIDNKSIISYASTVYDIEGNLVELPPPPSTHPAQSEFTCEFCWVVCPFQHARGKIWREHILRDLQPYMCTYADCPESNTMYGTRASWGSHEERAHRRVWRCYEHTDLFKSQAALKHHLETVHQNLGQAQIQAIVDLGHASVKDDREICPFCLSSGSFKKGLASHMASHMETLARFAIPRTSWTKDDESFTEKNSNSAQGTQSCDDLGSVSLDFSPDSSPSESTFDLFGPGDSPKLSPKLATGEERLEEEELEELKHTYLDWVSHDDWSYEQNRLTSTRHPGTGRWLFESAEFQAWLSKPQQTLFCPGNPGVGKTNITSAVVEYLETKYGKEKAVSVGIAYLFFNLADPRYTPLYAIRSLVKQLMLQETSVPLYPRDSYSFRKEKRVVDDYLRWRMVHAVAEHSRVFIVLDALDEFEMLNGLSSEFLAEIRAFQKLTGANVFASSRPMPEVIHALRPSMTLEIRTSQDDMRAFINDQLSCLSDAITRDLELHDRVMVAILQSSEGIYALARHSLEYLSQFKSATALIDALKRLPTQYDASYGLEMKRLDAQPTYKSSLAKRAVLWVACSKRPLTSQQLQHALSVEIGNTKLVSEDLLALDEILSVCDGLISVNEDGLCVLFHHTAEEYFERTRDKWCLVADPEVGEVCVAYLSFDVFDHGPCLTDEEFEDRLSSYPLYDYAATFWGIHISEAVKPISSVMPFLRDKQKTSAASQSMIREKVSPLFQKYPVNSPLHITGLHLAAYFGQDTAVAALVASGISPDAQTVCGHTPMFYAIVQGHKAVIELLLEHGADLEARGEDGRTPLQEAVIQRDTGIIKMLLDKGANSASRDNSGQSSLDYAVVSAHGPTIEILVDSGAALDPADN